MENRDKILFALPVVIAFIVVAFAGISYWQLSYFEKSYYQDAKDNIAQQTKTVSLVLTRMLNEGKLDEARKFCQEFKKDSLRITLINSAGTVVADSIEKSDILSNHLDREEVKSAMTGSPNSIIRYSESLHKWMIYHAERFNTENGVYVVRSAVSTDRISRVVTHVKINMGLALLLGAALAGLIMLYILNRVRAPLLALQNAVGKIAAGDLDTEIEVPPQGILYELADDISNMTEQLKRQLASVVSERNEKQIILDSMNNAILLLSPDGEAVRFNTAAAKLFDIKGAKAKFNISRSGINGLLPLVNETRQNGKSFEKELEFRRGDILYTLLVRGRTIREMDDPFILITITDLTNLRKLESFRSDFVANVSHEIRTPLTGIIGAVETLLEVESLDRVRTEKLHELILTQSNRLNVLIQDILSLAAIERKHLDQSQEFFEVKLDSMLVNAVNLCRQKADKAEVELVITQNTPLTIQADAQLLEQAVTNLINNAISYSGSSRIEVSLTRREQQAMIEVRDFGVGIAAEHHERIFERFYRVHKERSRELGGTGLGLAIVKHIAQVHKGFPEVSSKLGEGSAFRIILPLSSGI